MGKHKRPMDKLRELMAEALLDTEKTDVEFMIQLSEILREVHHYFYSHLSKISSKAKERKYSLEDLVDLGFLCRETEVLLDDWRKDAKARKELAGKLIAMIVTQKSLSDPTASETVRGTLATGSPDVKIVAILPKKDTKEYEMVLDYFYVPRRAVADGILKLDWKKVREFVTLLVEEGKPKIKGLDKTYPEYSTVFRKLTKKGK